MGGIKKNPSTMIIITMPVRVTLFDYVLHLFFLGVFFFCAFFVIYFSKVSGKFLEMIISMRPIFVRLFELVIYSRSRVWGGKGNILIQRL